MRDLKRNQQTIWYSLLNVSASVDEWGNTQDVKTYGEPVSIKMTLSGNKGEAYGQAFGADLKYDREMSTHDMNCPIDEYAHLWLDGRSTKTVTLTSIDTTGTPNVNFPAHFVADKPYNVMAQFVVSDEGGYEITTAKYLEGVRFVDSPYLPSCKSLDIDFDDSPEYFAGIHIYLNMFYDFTVVGGNENGPGGKDGWVWVVADYPSSGYNIKYTITITEA